MERTEVRMLACVTNLAGEKPAHRKTEVSRATLIVPGLVGPKAYPKGEVDGHLVNIPELAYVCPSDAS